MIYRWISTGLGAITGAIIGNSIDFSLQKVSMLYAFVGWIISLILVKPNYLRHFLIFLFSAVYAFSFMQIAKDDFNHVSWRSHLKTLIVEGEVISFPRKLNRSQVWSLKLKSFRTEEGERMKANEKIEISVPRDDLTPLIGDYMQVRGIVYFSNSDDAIAKKFKKISFIKGISAKLKVRSYGSYIVTGFNVLKTPLRMVQIFREHLQKRIDNLYEEKNSALLKAILLGIKFKNEQLRNIFNRTGTAHLLAVSGFHAGVIGGAIFYLAILMRFVPRQAVIVACAGIFIFAMLAGWGIAVQRASIMASLVWIAWAIGRPQKLGYWLLVALSVLLLKNPIDVWNISFQLSFLSMFGIIYIAPSLKKLFKLPGLDVSLSAFIASYPVVLYYFQTWAWVGVFMNLLIVPIFALIIPLGFLSLIPFIGLPLSMVVKGLLKIVLSLMEGVSSLSWTCISLSQPDLSSLFSYYVVGGLCLFFHQRRNWD